uniref:Fermentation-respiration switch protein n=1 Tax=Pithovirus LCDPAC02 TaxID=2506601 RepID=A0A481YPR2_9VIRU|nr:MAG: fermentation-respiration switch protein [Pithovirus LCDPAC02]
MNEQNIIIFLIILIFLFLIIFILKDQLDKKIRNNMYIPLSANNIDTLESSVYTFIDEKEKTIKINYLKYFNENSDYTIFYFHGRYGNLNLYKPLFDLLKSVGNVNIILNDYRGYGKSEGNTNIRNMINDSDRLVKKYINKYKKTKIVFWGESLGSIIACKLSSMYKIDLLVIYGGISSINNMLQYNKEYQKYYFIHTVLGLYNISNFKSLKSNMSRKTIFLHSKNDKIINIQCAIDNYNKCSCKDKILFKINGSHAKPKFTQKSVNYILSYFECEKSKIKFLHKLNDTISNISF